MPSLLLAAALSLGSVMTQLPEGAAIGPAPMDVSSDIPEESPVAAAPVKKPHTRWGLLLDGGLPDLAGASVLFRPLPWLRFNAGLATNSVGVAARAGVGVAFYFPITPSFNLDVGHYFGADYRPLFEKLGVSEGKEITSPVLQNLSYDFASATVGLEVGSPRHFSFFVRAGISYWSFGLSQSEAALRAALEDEGISADDIQLRFTSPSAKLGFLIYFM